MNFKRISSAPPLTPYAPQWDYTLGTRIFKNINLNVLAKTCLEKEREIKKLPVAYVNGDVNDGNTGLGKNSTTSKYQFYNVLEWKTPETDQLKSNIITSLFDYNSHLKNQTTQVWVSCWVNILRWGQNLKPHLHLSDSRTYLSGHFKVQNSDTSTCYMLPFTQIKYPVTTNIKNREGELTLFPSYINHYTTKHYSFKPRITIAFDLCLEKKFNSMILL